MKKATIKLFLTAALAVFTGLSYAQLSEDKVAPAKRDVTDTKEDHLLQSDTLSDYKTFKAEMDKKIRENDKRIADLKAKKQEGTQEVKDKYNKRVAELEQKNKDLKKRINDYKDTKDESKWQSFKREFNHDMKELGQSLRDLGKDNVK
jgi:TolA-binding protein